jgi:hypothetical protein
MIPKCKCIIVDNCKCKCSIDSTASITSIDFVRVGRHNVNFDF